MKTRILLLALVIATSIQGVTAGEGGIVVEGPAGPGECNKKSGPPQSASPPSGCDGTPTAGYIETSNTFDNWTGACVAGASNQRCWNTSWTQTTNKKLSQDSDCDPSVQMPGYPTTTPMLSGNGSSC